MVTKNVTKICPRWSTKHARNRSFQRNIFITPKDIKLAIKNGMAMVVPAKRGNTAVYFCKGGKNIKAIVRGKMSRKKKIVIISIWEKNI